MKTGDCVYIRYCSTNCILVSFSLSKDIKIQPFNRTVSLPGIAFLSFTLIKFLSINPAPPPPRKLAYHIRKLRLGEVKWPGQVYIVSKWRSQVTNASSLTLEQILLYWPNTVLVEHAFKCFNLENLKYILPNTFVYFKQFYWGII